jgi:glyoxylase-like metal-dependent hydrolase (beta-lactamase superfamily II)
MSGGGAVAFLTEPVPPRGEATQAWPGIRRIVADNPGPMTYHGTNTYLLDQPEGVVVVDPGPDDDAHVQAILRASGGTLRAILLSHTHADHLGAVAALRSATGAPVAAWHAPSRAGFVPDQALSDGDLVAGCRVLHTPGHAADHVCFAYGAVLFSADHVMSWSSSIVSPPDGDMAAYFASLRRLLARDDVLYLPGHGPPLPAPRGLVAELLAHRIAREAAVLAALDGLAKADVPAITGVVYAAAPASVRPMAERNVLAHLLKLLAEGVVTRTGAAWQRI